MHPRLVTAAGMIRRGEWHLLAAYTTKMLGWNRLLSHMTCPISIPGESHRPLRIYVEPGDVISDDICATGVWELMVTRAILARVRPGGVLIDVGANLGYYSMLWIAFGGRIVHAAEPSPRIFEKLQRNLRLNRLEQEIQIYPFAFSDTTGTAAFDPGPQRQTGWGSLQLGPGRPTIEVETVRLDDFFSGRGSIDVLKIDTEGWDGQVLRGSETLLRARRIGAVYFEQHHDRLARLGVTIEETCDFLKSCGYVVRRIPDPRFAEEHLTEWEAIPS